MYHAFGPGLQLLREVGDEGEGQQLAFADSSSDYGTPSRRTVFLAGNEDRKPLTGENNGSWLSWQALSPHLTS